MNLRTKNNTAPVNLSVVGAVLYVFRKLYNSGELKDERAERLRKLVELCERYRRKNQYE